MKNILFLSSWYPSKVHATLGNFVQYHANAIALKHKVYVLYIVPHEDKSFEISNELISNVDTTIVYFNRGRFKYFNYLIAFRKGLSILINKRKISFDVAHMSILHPACWQALYVNWKFKLPYIISENWHGLQDLSKYNIRGLRKYLIKLTIKKASFVCPVSIQLKKAIENAGFSGEFKVIPNVVDTTIFSLSNPKDQQGFTFLHVSTLTDSIKNISGIIDSFSKLKKENVKLRIIGDGPNAWIQDKVDALNLSDKVLIEGEMTYEDISKAMKEASAFVLFSNIENLPLVLIESMATGTPIITTNVGGISEIFDESKGIMIDAGNQTQLIEAMNNMIENISNYNTETIREFAVAKFSKEVIANQFDQLYEKAISS